MFFVGAVFLVFCLLFGGRLESLLDLLCFNFSFRNSKGTSVTGTTWRRRAEIPRCRKKKDNLRISSDRQVSLNLDLWVRVMVKEVFWRFTRKFHREV